MVPRRQEQTSEHDEGTSSDSEEESRHSISGALEHVDEDAEHLASADTEYHTEDSDEESDEEESDVDLGSSHNTAPLLPKELLKPLPSPAYSLQQHIDIPREQMSRQHKVAQRHNSRKSKKRVWDKLRQDAQGTGVLEAGKFAQLKRGIVLKKDKVTSGRVVKKRADKPQVSGRQQLLEQRKRAVEQSKSELLRPQRKGRARRRKRAGAG